MLTFGFVEEMLSCGLHCKNLEGKSQAFLVYPQTSEAHITITISLCGGKLSTYSLDHPYSAAVRVGPSSSELMLLIISSF